VKAPNHAEAETEGSNSANDVLKNMTLISDIMHISMLNTTVRCNNFPFSESKYGAEHYIMQ
jgi:hypothetical protein